MTKKKEKEQNTLISHKNLERNVATEIANEFHKNQPKQQ
jgi:hypothetical protein